MNASEQFLSHVPDQMKEEFSRILASGNFEALLGAINAMEDTSTKMELNSKLVLVANTTPFRRGIQ